MLAFARVFCELLPSCSAIQIEHLSGPAIGGRWRYGHGVPFRPCAYMKTCGGGRLPSAGAMRAKLSHLRTKIGCLASAKAGSMTSLARSTAQRTAGEAVAVFGTMDTACVGLPPRSWCLSAPAQSVAQRS